MNGMTCVVSQGQGVLEEEIRVYGGLGTPQHDQGVLVVLGYEHHALSSCLLTMSIDADEMMYDGCMLMDYLQSMVKV